MINQELPPTMKRHFILFLITLSSIYCNAQIHPIGGQLNNTSGSLNGNYSKSLPIHIAISENDAYGREVLNELARLMNKPPRTSALVIDFNLVIKANNNNFNKSVSIDGTTFRYSGDVNYKGFNLNETLSPIYYTAKAKVIYQNGQSSVFPINGNIYNSLINQSSFNFTDSLNQARDIDISDFKLIYNSNCINKIRDRTDLINDYYNGVKLLDNTYGHLRSINLNDIENYKTQQLILDESDIELNELENKNYYNLLQLSQFDPAQLNKKLSECRSLSSTLRQQYNQMMANLYALFYNRGIDLLRAGNIPKAEQYFHFSLELNPLFAPSLLQLGVIDFRRDNLTEAICKADDILYNLYPDPDTKDRTFDLIRDIYEKRVDLGNAFLKQNKDYYKAVDQFEEARRICEKYTAVRCDDQLFMGIRTSKNGIYQDHLNHGRIAIQQNKLADADEALDNAIRYQSLNARDITDNSEALTLKKVIRQRYYDQKLAEAKVNINAKNYDAALLNFDEAEQMLKQYDLIAPSDLKLSQQNAARPRSSELFYEGDKYIEQADLANAGKKLQAAIQLQTKYDLTNDKELNKLKEELRKRISTQECINAQEEIKELFNNGMIKKGNNELLDASDAFNQALEIARKFNNCAIDVSQIESNELEIRPAATYLNMMREFKDKESKRQFNDCLTLYSKATNYFTSKNISNYGISHDPDFFNYVQSNGSNGLIAFAADDYRSKNELEKSLTLYKLLLDHHVDEKSISGSLFELGYKFGKRELNTNPGGKAKSLVKIYTSDDKRMKRFEKGFSKGYYE
ncbi:MAG: hypothetical protein ACKOX3_10165 [Bacteroidota bacterium]